MNWAELGWENMNRAELSASGINWVELRIDYLNCAKLSWNKLGIIRI